MGQPIAFDSQAWFSVRSYQTIPKKRSPRPLITYCPAKSKSVGPHMRAIPNCPKSTLKIPKNRGGSGRRKGDLETPYPEVEGSSPCPGTNVNPHTQTSISDGPALIW